MITKAVTCLLAEPSLADAGLTVDQDDTALIRPGTRHGEVELIKDLVSANEGDSLLGHFPSV